jgi:RNA polymerase sigma-70 factor (ECF subfamily)
LRTVETRLLRGRARLRERLLRLGVVPLAVLMVVPPTATAAVPAAWRDATVRAGILFTSRHTTAAGIVSATAVSLAKGVLYTMCLKTLGLAATSLLTLSGLAVAGGLWSHEIATRTAPAAAEPPAFTPSIPAEAPTLEPSRFLSEPTPAQKKGDPPKDSTRELALDDGQMKGRRSIAGGGHAVRFEAPGEGDGWMLTAVKIHGSRYGYPRPPREDFKVFLCDDQFRPIAEFAFPYSKFERGNSRWVTLEVKPTKLPKKFILGVGFNPTQTKGVYLSHDGKGTGRSLVGLPGEQSQPFEQGDWLIRAEVTPGK